MASRSQSRELGYVITKLPEGGYLIETKGQINFAREFVAAFTQPDEALDFLMKKFVGDDSPAPDATDEAS